MVKNINIAIANIKKVSVVPKIVIKVIISVIQTGNFYRGYCKKKVM